MHPFLNPSQKHTVRTSSHGEILLVTRRAAHGGSALSRKLSLVGINRCHVIVGTGCPRARAGRGPRLPLSVPTAPTAGRQHSAGLAGRPDKTHVHSCPALEWVSVTAVHATVRLRAKATVRLSALGSKPLNRKRKGGGGCRSRGNQASQGASQEKVSVVPDGDNCAGGDSAGSHHDRGHALSPGPQNPSADVWLEPVALHPPQQRGGQGYPFAPTRAVPTAAPRWQLVSRAQTRRGARVP